MPELLTKKKDIVAFFLEKGVLLNSEILDNLNNEDFFQEVTKLIEENKHDITVLNSVLKELIEKQTKDLNVSELDKVKTLSEKSNALDFDKSVEPLLAEEPSKEAQPQSRVEVVFSYNEKPNKKDAQDFVDHFKQRYKKLSSILKQRQELQSSLSIQRLYNKKDREDVSIVGLVQDKQYTKNDNCMLTLEDETGQINVLISKNKRDLFEKTRDIVLDEVVGITGTNGDKIVFANNLLFPDVPLTKELRRTKDDVYAIFLSDLHVGSNNFLEEDFEKFLDWLNGSVGDEKQKEIASKVEYIFLIGDLVDGCGIYPGQETELTINDLKGQYDECARLLKKIPSRIDLIVCPGNHDAMRVAEPQLPIYPEFAQSLYDMPNVTMVSNPAWVKFHKTETFPGFDVLMYHGYSFDYYVAEVESIRNNGGYDRADLVMKLLLQKRHLAPNHASTLYTPSKEMDPLVIDNIPDFFVSGHIHKTAATNYRNITLLCGSCWQKKTAFQEKVGHNPEPSRVPVVSLRTRDIKIMRFGE